MPLTRAAVATIAVRGQVLMLMPERCVFLPDSDTLLVADAHIGQAVGVGPPGEPEPAGATDETLSTLTSLVRRLSAQRIIFLGDFLPSARSLAPGARTALTRWRALHGALELTLVRGSHDDLPVDPPSWLDMQAFDEPLMHRGLALCHRPRPVPQSFVLAGHLHPCVSLGGRAHDWQRLPCFWFSEHVGVLPAFGAFAGMQAIRPRRGERVFASTADRVFELQPKPKRR